MNKMNKTPKNDAMYTISLLRKALQQNVKKEYWFRQETLEAMTEWMIEKEAIWQILQTAEICDVLKHDTNYHTYREEVLVLGIWLLPLCGIDEYAYTKISLEYEQEQIKLIKLLSFKPLVNDFDSNLLPSLKLWHTDLQQFMDWNREAILAIRPNLCLQMENESFTIQIARTLLDQDPLYMQYIPDDCLTQAMVEKAVARDERCGNMIPDDLMSLRAFYYAIIVYPQLITYFPEHVDEETVPYFVGVQPFVFPYLPAEFQTQQLAMQAVEIEPSVIEVIPQQYINQKLANEALSRDPHVIKWINNKYKTVKNCYQIVQSIPELYEYVPAFVSRKFAI
ncbi:MAG: hypothetical protein ACRDD4_05770 [Culicoidibacterales bacterium]